MKDKRISKLAYNLINYSCALKKGEKVLIEAFGVDNALVNACVEEAEKIGAFPFVTLRDHSVIRAMLSNSNEEHLKLWAKYDVYRDEKTWSSARSLYILTADYNFTKNLKLQMNLTRVNDRAVNSLGGDGDYNMADLQVYVRF